MNSDKLLFRNQEPFNKLAFTDDINLVVNETVDVKGEFIQLKEASKHVDMTKNENKRKYVTRT